MRHDDGEYLRYMKRKMNSPSALEVWLWVIVIAVVAAVVLL